MHAGLKSVDLAIFKVTHHIEARPLLISVPAYVWPNFQNRGDWGALGQFLHFLKFLEK